MTERKAVQLSIATLEELAEMGWRPGEHTASIAPMGRGKTVEGVTEIVEQPPALRLRLHPEPPEAA